MSKTNKINIEPIDDRVLVLPDEAKDKVGEIFLPEASKEAPQEGTVVATGPGLFKMDGERMPLQVKVGDRVILNKFGGVEVEYNKVKYKLLPQNEVMGILR
jgi:chaperonin GroES